MEPIFIAAYPCLGKTTFAKKYEQSILDSEFRESAHTRHMTEQESDRFFDLCADILSLHKEAEDYPYIFITEDERLLARLKEKGIHPVLVFPNPADLTYMEEYERRVIQRSGLEWFQRLIEPELPGLEERIKNYREEGYEIYLTDSEHPFLSEVYTFSSLSTSLYET